MSVVLARAPGIASNVVLVDEFAFVTRGGERGLAEFDTCCHYS